MTPFTQNLNIGWVGSSGKMAGMRLYMMTLKTSNAFAFLAFFAFINNLRNCFSRGIASSANTTIPQWVIFSSHVLTTYFSHTWNRTILSSSTPPLSYLKWLIASFTYTINKLALFAWFYKLSAISRTSVSCPTVMTSKDLKTFVTRRTGQTYFAPAGDFSRSI